MRQKYENYARAHIIIAIVYKTVSKKSVFEHNNTIIKRFEMRL